MSSINTNNGAMVALQTLKSVNKNLGEVQGQISTGLKVGSSKDNAAVFAISQVMKSDVTGFKAISESLSLGASTLAVGASATESVGNLLNEIKGKVVSANEDNVDRTKIQSEISSLIEQVGGVVSAAQFNGLNLVDGSTDGANGYSVLSSLDRNGDGVSTSSISFDPSNTNISTDGGTALGAAAATIADAGVAGTLDAAATGNNTFSIGGFQMLNNASSPGATAALKAEDVDLTTGTPDDGLLVGDVIEVSIGETNASYTVREGDLTANVASGLRQSMLDAGIDTDKYTVDTTTVAGALTITNTTEEATTVSSSIERSAGGLSGLEDVDVTTKEGAQSALAAVERFIQTTVDAQAQIGTTQKRVDIQSDFMGKLTDSFTSGIGSLVDADMESASARLQALQVQQQLGTQALSIANQAPQQLVSLFR